MAGTTSRGIVLRLSTQGEEAVKAALKSLGADGERALKQLERSAAPVTPALRAIDTTAKQVHATIKNEFNSAISSVVGMISPVNLLSGAFGALVGSAVGWVTGTIAGLDDADDRLEEHKQLIEDIAGAYDDAKKGVTDYASASLTVLLARNRATVNGLIEDLNDQAHALEQSITNVLGGNRTQVIRPQFEAFAQPINDLLATIRAGAPDVEAFQSDVGNLMNADPDNSGLQAIGLQILNLSDTVAATSRDLAEGEARLQDFAGGTDDATASAGKFADAMDRLNGIGVPDLSSAQQVMADFAAAMGDAATAGDRVAATVAKDLALNRLEAGSLQDALDAAQAFLDVGTSSDQSELEKRLADIHESANQVRMLFSDILTAPAFDLSADQRTTIEQYLDRLDASEAAQVTAATNAGGGATDDPERKRLEALADTILHDVNPAKAAQADLDDRLADISALVADNLLQEGDATAATAAAYKDYNDAVAAAAAAAAAGQPGWQKGVIDALDTIADKAMDAGEQIGSALTSAFDEAQKAFDAWVDGGEFSFKEFVASILGDIAKMEFGQAESAGAGLLETIVHALVGGAAGGGKPMQLAAGGPVHGPGTGTSDSIPARLSAGEYVVNAVAADHYRPLLDAINGNGAPGYAAGGSVANTPVLPILLPSSGGGDVHVTLHTTINAQGSNLTEAQIRRAVEESNRQFADRLPDIINRLKTDGRFGRG